MGEQYRNGARALVTALAFASVSPGIARAADLLSPPPLENIEEERVTFGTGWYLRGDIAAANEIKISVGGATLPSAKGFFNSWSGGLGFGYKYNDWLRTDVTGDFRNNRQFEGNTAAGILCQGSAAPVVNAVGTVVGSTPVYGSCYDYTRAKLTSFNVLFNAYADLGTWYGVTPYVGAGLGFNSLYQQGSQNWFFGNGNTYNPTWTDPFTGATYSRNWDQARSNRSLQFAWAAMAGASYAVTRHVAVDLGYRFLGLGNVTNYSALTGAVTRAMRAQEVRVGVRYTPD